MPASDSVSDSTPAAGASALIEARGWGWRHAGRQRWALRDLDFTIEAGERVLLLGSSGSGKSTLLRALAGVLGDADEGEAAGRLLIDGRHPARTIGRQALVQQDPESQVVLSRVGDDVAFGCENLRVPPREIWPRVRHALDQVGLDVPLDHPTHRLSGGQKQRLALAGAIAMRSEIVLLDEPTANLDPEGVAEVIEAVGRLVADRRATLIVVEHRVAAWSGLVDRVIVLDESGGVLADGPIDRVLAEQRDPLLAAGVWVPGARLDPDLVGTRQLGAAHVGAAHLSAQQFGPSAPDEPLLWAEQVQIGRDRALPVRPVVSSGPGSTGSSTRAHAVSGGFDLALPAGSTVITGPNGAGKSTLLLTMAGLLEPVSGRVVASSALRARATGRPLGPEPLRWRSRDLAGRIGTVFQEVEHMFVAATAREEIELAVRTKLGRNPSPQRVEADVAALLEQLHLTDVARANPFTLSGGQKRRLSVGVVLGAGPQLIMVDEPTFGQDRTAWHDVVRLFVGLLADGHSVVSVTHDEPFIDVMSQHRVRL